jgi:alpha,alpha-trehalase
MALRLPLDELDAVIFDLDGVITKTANVHAAAWKRLFDEFLKERAGRTGEPFRPFEDHDYLTYVDGKPRYDGVESFLESRRIELPWGDPSDPPEAETVCGLGNRKNRYFLDHLHSRGVDAYPTSLALVDALRARSVKTALISASRNARPVLEAAGAIDRFDVIVDGVDARKLGLAGKPDPAVFLEAARRLGVEPRRAAVVEDALAGVEAGRSGGFRLVLGVDRGHQAAELSSHGADLVVTDLGEVLPFWETALDDLPSALRSFEDIADCLRDRRPAVFLDYDGTLTPIVAHPDLAVLAPPMRAALERLMGSTTVAIVSGRDVADVRDKVELDGIYYAGSHGLDIVTPAGTRAEEEDLAGFDEFLPVLEDAESRLEAAVAAVEGAWVERKRFAIAVHYRQTPPHLHDSVRRAVEAVASQFPPLRMSGGKMIFELRPDIDWDKGRALLWLLERMGLDGEDVVPLYLGDDVTDEDAFAAIGGRGIGIVVGIGDRRSAADYAVRDVGEVETLLSRLASNLEQRSDE